MPAPNGAEYEAYNEWLHYSEGSAMLPLMLNLYVSRLKEAGAPLHPRIDSEIANHLGHIDGALDGREFFVGPSLTGADIQMSFVGEMAKVFEKLGPYPNLKAWLSRMHARPAFQRSVDEGRGVPLCEMTHRRPGERREPYRVTINEAGRAACLFQHRSRWLWAPAQGRGDVGEGSWPTLAIPATPTISCINIKPVPQVLGHFGPM